MSKEQQRKAALELAVVAAEAESLADDLKNGRLWEGDCARRMGSIGEHLEAARRQAKDDR